MPIQYYNLIKAVSYQAVKNITQKIMKNGFADCKNYRFLILRPLEAAIAGRIVAGGQVGSEGKMLFPDGVSRDSTAMFSNFPLPSVVPTAEFWMANSNSILGQQSTAVPLFWILPQSNFNS
jgi:hypothetical protein